MIPLDFRPPCRSMAAAKAATEGRAWFTHPTAPGRLLPAAMGGFGSVPPFDTHCWHGEPLAGGCDSCPADLAAIGEAA